MRRSLKLLHRDARALLTLLRDDFDPVVDQRPDALQDLDVGLTKMIAGLRWQAKYLLEWGLFQLRFFTS